ncbi:MAG: hypothetical protein K2Y39_15365 [Candidatus Obscuribacterales bacterium]|nr:hypothetical protein [Candidatus Obscuribacterales bacterium]
MRKKAAKADFNGQLEIDRWLAGVSCDDSQEICDIYDAAHDESLSEEIRALLFLIYGSKIAGTHQKQPVFTDQQGWLRRAFYFGLKYGLPPQPKMISRILEYEDGIDLSVAYVRECDAAPVFKIRENLGIALLDRGMDAQSLISLCRALHAIEPLSERLLDASEELAMILPHLRQDEEPKAIKLRSDQVDRLAELIGEYMLRTRSTKVVILLAGFINTMLATAPLTSQLVGTIECALSEFLQFDDAKLADCLKIEIDQDRGKVTSSLKEVTEILNRAGKAE